MTQDKKQKPVPMKSAKKPAEKPAEKPAALRKAQKRAAGAVAMVANRNSFYRDGYRNLVTIAMVQAIIIVVMVIAFIIFMAIVQPRNQYFATTEDGRLVPMVALAEPNLSHPALISWAAQGVTEVMTFGFHDYKTRLQESSRHFTRPGWDSFTRALQQSGVIDAVSKNKQVVTAVPRSAPIIRSEGIKNDRYQWEIEIPMLINFQLGAGSRPVSQTIRLTIVRVPRLESPSGVGIEQWVAFSG